MIRSSISRDLFGDFASIKCLLLAVSCLTGYIKTKLIIPLSSDLNYYLLTIPI